MSLKRNCGEAAARLGMIACLIGGLFGTGNAANAQVLPGLTASSMALKQATYPGEVSDWVIHLGKVRSVKVMKRELMTTLESLAPSRPVKVQPLLQPGSWRVSWPIETLPFNLQDPVAMGSYLNSLPGVDFASPNVQLPLASVDQPTDPAYLPRQSSYLGQVTPFSMNLPSVWRRTRGSSQSVIAVLDSGVLFGHPDLQGRLLVGYDFVSEASAPTGSGQAEGGQFSGSNDGDGRDPDPSDPGDAPPIGTVCPGTGQTDSSFHGTSVSSVAAAQSDNGAFITGVDWNARILPLRVSGRCGTALVSDIIDAMYWAIGAESNDLPTNPNRADVINLSFAAQESLLLSCQNGSGAAIALAIQDAVSAGTPVVVSAGNSGSELGYPATCPGAIAAAALTNSGRIAVYSSRGQTNNAITLYVPGDPDARYAAASNAGLNDGRPDPGGHTAAMVQGTSFSAPLLSAVVSLLKGASPELSFQELLTHLDETSRELPAPSGCSTSGSDGGFLGGFRGGQTPCGSGALNPPGALTAVANASNLPFVNVPQAQVLNEGVDSLSLDAGLSQAANGSDMLTFSWRQLTGSPITAAGVDQSVLSITSGIEGNQAELLLTVTDTQTNETQSGSVLLVSQASGADRALRDNVGDPRDSGIQNTESGSAPRTSPSGAGEPQPASSGGGGGAMASGLGLMWLVCLAFAARRRF